MTTALVVLALVAAWDEPKKGLSFADAYAAAEKRAAQLDKEEPAATEAAMKLLTGKDKIEAGNLRANPSLYLPRGAAGLRRLGLSAWVERESRKIALADRSFKGTAARLWDPETGDKGVLKMMNVWGTIPDLTRRAIPVHVASGTPAKGLTASERDAILTLGGEKWLKR